MRPLSLASALLVVAGCGLSPEAAEEKLSHALERVVERDDDVRHAVLQVSAPSLGLDGRWAFGTAQPGGAPMSAETPFYSASVGKLFTAAAVLALTDEGTLSLDDAVTDWLDPALVDGLSVTDVTVRQLLSHRSGLPDYFSDETHDGEPNVLALLTAAPGRVWDPEALLSYTAAHFSSVGAPGEAFHYADTNYDLLGLIVESATGEAFHAVVRRTVLAPLSLEQTWYHRHEAAPDGLPAPAGLWVGDHNVAGTEAMSLDWAGGGLLTTTADLATFLRGLEAGTPVSLDRFSVWSDDAITDGIDYGYGLWRVRPSGLSWLLSGPEVVGVSGVTGSFVYLEPESGAVVTGTFDQSLYEEEHIVYLVTKLLPTLERVTVE